jgi:fibronectin-binding autotransporter adhesin
MVMERASFGCALLLAAALAGPVRAQDPFPFAIFDLVAVNPATLPSYTEFTTSFTGDITGTEFVSFAFRDAPGFFAFDDASVIQQGDTTNTNLLTDGDFESNTPGNVATTSPVGWQYWSQPVDNTGVGQVAASGTNQYGCNVPAHSGTYFWCDGSLEGYDALYQPIATTLGQTYNIAFWLEEDSGQNIVNPTLDMLVYAGDSIPVASATTGATPEPASLGLLGVGLLAFSLIRRRL